MSATVNSVSARVSKGKKVAVAGKLQKRISLVATLALGAGLLVAAPAFAASPSPTNTVTIINLGTGTSAKSDARIIHSRVADRTAGSQAATIVVSLNDDTGSAITSDTLTVSLSGPGSLGTGAGTTTGFVPTGRTVTVSPSSSVPGKFVFAIFGDGTGGFSTISIRDDAVLLATKFAAFYGPIASLSAFPNLLLPDVNGNAIGSNSMHNPGDGTFVHTPAVILTGKDANGVPVPDEDPTEFSAVSSDLSVLSPEVSVMPDDGLGAGSLGAGTYNVQIRSASGSVSGKSATLTFRYSTDGVNFVSTAPVTFTVTSTFISRVILTMDKAIYAPGESATATITVYDPAGNPASGQDSGNFFASSAGLSTSAPINKLLFPFTTVTFIDGKATTTFDLPTTSGLFTLGGRLGNGANLLPSLQGVPISSTVTILTPQEVDIAATRVSAAAALSAVMSLTEIVKAMMISNRAMSIAIAKLMKRFKIK
jgi:hypothetical protein